MLKEYNTEERYWLWMNKYIGDNVRAFTGLIRHYGSAADVFRCAKNKTLRPIEKVKSELITSLTNAASERIVDDFVSLLEEKQVKAVTGVSDDYPYLLSQIYDPPSVLYYRGRIQRDYILPLAMIGSRRCSNAAVKIAHSLAHYLSEIGITVVSGLAHGVDSESACGALSCHTNDMPTIAVLGSGIDVVYPSDHKRLYSVIAERGCVVSEYAPGIPSSKDKFPKRNRIISGLSKGVIVVEAGKKSGTNITVEFALEQGRDVFSLPGRINDEHCWGSNRLIKDNAAKPVFGMNDILVEYGMECDLATQQVLHARIKRSNRQVVMSEQMPNEYKQICRLLESGAKTFDEMCEIIGFDVAYLNNLLTEMELSQIIVQSAGRLYSLHRS